MIRALVLAAFGLLLAPALACAAQADTATVAAPDAPGARRVMVMLRLGAEHYRAGGDYGGAYGDAMGEQARLRLARKIAREHGLSVVENWPMQLVGVDCIVMEVRDDRTLEAVAAELTGLPGVAWSQPLNEFRTQGASQATGQGSGQGAVGVVYNDRLSGAQPWHLAPLHRLATGKGVTIAIIDSLIDLKHPDLAGQISGSRDFVAPNHPAAERHGTGVAGIIGARPNNALGIAGVSPGARILGLRACWERPYGGNTVCDTLSLAKALMFAIEARVNVINLSLTGPPDRLLEGLVVLSLQRGITVVAAVDGQHPRASFPAFVEGVIPVAAARLSPGEPAVYIAPGQDVPTTEPEGKWSVVSGSSFAAAHVSGLAALLRQLSGPGRSLSAATMLGPRGIVDACAAVGRVSRLDVPACEAGR
ncbi:MAG: S8 family peptidase [Novosphingobium sp.]